MNMLARSPNWTIEGFLEWEASQELRFEFNGFEPVAMVGAPVGHQRLIRNVMRALEHRLGGSRCEVFSETVKLRLKHTVRYPDLMVVCSQPAGSASYVTDPVVVIEVLSESTAQEDRITKNEEYRLTPSIQHYILLEQGRAAATVFVRVDDDWVGRVVTDGTIALPEIGVDLPILDIYAGVLD